MFNFTPRQTLEINELNEDLENICEKIITFRIGLADASKVKNEASLHSNLSVVSQSGSTQIAVRKKDKETLKEHFDKQVKELDPIWRIIQQIKDQPFIKNTTDNKSFDDTFLKNLVRACGPNFDSSTQKFLLASVLDIAMSTPANTKNFIEALIEQQNQFPTPLGYRRYLEDIYRHDYFDEQPYRSLIAIFDSLKTDENSENISLHIETIQKIALEFNTRNEEMAEIASDVLKEQTVSGGVSGGGFYKERASLQAKAIAFVAQTKDLSSDSKEELLTQYQETLLKQGASQEEVDVLSLNQLPISEKNATVTIQNLLVAYSIENDPVKKRELASTLTFYFSEEQHQDHLKSREISSQLSKQTICNLIADSNTSKNFLACILKVHPGFNSPQNKNEIKELLISANLSGNDLISLLDLSRNKAQLVGEVIKETPALNEKLAQLSPTLSLGEESRTFLGEMLQDIQWATKCSNEQLKILLAYTKDVKVILAAYESVKNTNQKNIDEIKIEMEKDLQLSPNDSALKTTWSWARELFSEISHADLRKLPQDEVSMRQLIADLMRDNLDAKDYQDNKSVLFIIKILGKLRGNQKAETDGQKIKEIYTSEKDKKFIDETLYNIIAMLLKAKETIAQQNRKTGDLPVTQIYFPVFKELLTLIFMRNRPEVLSMENLAALSKEIHSLAVKLPQLQANIHSAEIAQKRMIKIGLSNPEIFSPSEKELKDYKNSSQYSRGLRQEKFDRTSYIADKIKPLVQRSAVSELKETLQLFAERKDNVVGATALLSSIFSLYKSTPKTIIKLFSTISEEGLNALIDRCRAEELDAEYLSKPLDFFRLCQKLGLSNHVLEVKLSCFLSNKDSTEIVFDQKIVSDFAKKMLSADPAKFDLSLQTSYEELMRELLQNSENVCHLTEEQFENLADKLGNKILPVFVKLKEGVTQNPASLSHIKAATMLANYLLHAALGQENETHSQSFLYQLINIFAPDNGSQETTETEIDLSLLISNDLVKHIFQLKEKGKLTRELSLDKLGKYLKNLDLSDAEMQKLVMEKFPIDIILKNLSSAGSSDAAKKNGKYLLYTMMKTESYASKVLADENKENLKNLCKRLEVKDAIEFFNITNLTAETKSRFFATFYQKSLSELVAAVKDSDAKEALRLLMVVDAAIVKGQIQKLMDIAGKDFYTKFFTHPELFKGLINQGLFTLTEIVENASQVGLEATVFEQAIKSNQSSGSVLSGLKKYIPDYLGWCLYHENKDRNIQAIQRLVDSYVAEGDLEKLWEVKKNVKDYQALLNPFIANAIVNYPSKLAATVQKHFLSEQKIPEIDKGSDALPQAPSTKQRLLEIAPKICEKAHYGGYLKIYDILLDSHIQYTQGDNSQKKQNLAARKALIEMFTPAMENIENKASKTTHQKAVLEIFGKFKEAYGWDEKRANSEWEKAKYFMKHFFSQSPHQYFLAKHKAKRSHGCTISYDAIEKVLPPSEVHASHNKEQVKGVITITSSPLGSKRALSNTAKTSSSVAMNDEKKEDQSKKQVL